MGVDELSVGAASLPRVKEITRRLSYAEAQELAANSLHANHARDVVDMLTALVQRIDPDLLG